MIKKAQSLLILFMAVVSTEAICLESYKIQSPDNKILVDFRLTPLGEPVYSISYSGVTVLKQSRLGLVRSDGDFSTHLSLSAVSDVQLVRDSYQLLHGKRVRCIYSGNKRTFYLKNPKAQTLKIIFQVSDDGVAFRYHFPEKTTAKVRIYRESTSYHFDPAAKAFLQPCADARMQWCYSSPSYEEYYNLDIPVGVVAPNAAGWVLPALFNYGKYWICLSEAGVDTNNCGSRLGQFSPDGEYTVQYPQPQESKSGGPALPESTLPWLSPWRIVALADNLAGLVESTLETDLAAPAKYDVSSWLEPGLASWSWVILKDDSTVYDVQRRYIDFSAAMNWRYCLIDAQWDTQIGYEKIKQLADYAKTKNVKILLWYNSAGDWNTTPQTPRNKLLTRELRRAEFQKLHDYGIGGIKVDFFGGDGQSMMTYYMDILQDAAQYELAVNFHGSTFPRGWQRTFPNLIGMEAIRGEEYVTFGQFFADNQASHCTVIPFTRNLFDPMDFTPVNFSGIPNVQRRTTNGFELALSVLFTCGIQHIAETPGGMAAQPDYIKEYMRTVPVIWDDVQFIDGFPGKYVVLARKQANRWYIAGINGENSPRPLALDLSVLAVSGEGVLMTDSADAKEVVQQAVDCSRPIKLVLSPQGGFVIRTD
ncbi:MAG TPA: glycoside hydrolase family 97 catalytic domain-containing protein [bacterium]|nr:glycoside hydrolase family 97 catalytic domain-containing protein [bacterium]HQG45141.1 glycoside hydrolase family 97 catalytic domain-containing protein [bacterium]HQJ65255.1 glycoside hydrolase family 97 catalytic domain-containing protein [bacterium]